MHFYHKKDTVMLIIVWLRNVTCQVGERGLDCGYLLKETSTLGHSSQCVMFSAKIRNRHFLDTCSTSKIFLPAVHLLQLVILSAPLDDGESKPECVLTWEEVSHSLCSHHMCRCITCVVCRGCCSWRNWHFFFLCSRFIHGCRQETITCSVKAKLCHQKSDIYRCCFTFSESIKL